MRRVWRGLLCASVFLCVWVAAPARGAVIQLQFTATASYLSNGQMQIPLAIENKGDDAALAVRAVLYMGETTWVYPVYARLDPQARETHMLTLRWPPLPPGRYHLPLLVDYRNSAGRQYSAALAVAADTVTPAASGLELDARDIALEGGDGAGVVMIRNTSAVPRAIHLQVVPPRELIAGGLPDRLVIGPRSRRALPVHIHNEGGVSGSAYALSVIASYEAEGRHYSEAGRITVTVADSRSAAERFFAHTHIIYGVMGALVAMIVLAGLRDVCRARR